MITQKNSLITDGLTSSYPIIVTDGFTDPLEQVAILSGTLTVGGSAESSVEISYSSTGQTLTLSGIAEKTIELTYTPTGEEFIFNGISATEEFNYYTYTSTGTITLDGTAFVIGEDFAFSYDTSGTITLDGNAETIDNRCWCSHGDIVTVSGEVTGYIELNGAIGDGNIEINGVAASLETHDYTYDTTGTLTVGGIASSEIGYESISIGDITIEGIALSEIGYESISAGTLTIEGTSSATFTEDFYYTGTDKIILSGTAASLNIPIFVNYPTGEKLTLSGIAEVKFATFLEYIQPDEEEDIFNYATGLVHPDYQNEIRGRLNASDRNITRSSFNSKDRLRGKINCDERTVSSLSFNSKDKIRGSISSNDRLISSSSFNSKNKIQGKINSDERLVSSSSFSSKDKTRGKRTGREGGYNYEDDMFKK